jgi:hypothetical protein
LHVSAAFGASLKASAPALLLLRRRRSFELLDQPFRVFRNRVIHVLARELRLAFGVVMEPCHQLGFVASGRAALRLLRLLLALRLRALARVVTAFAFRLIPALRELDLRLRVRRRRRHFGRLRLNSGGRGRDVCDRHGHRSGLVVIAIGAHANEGEGDRGEGEPRDQWPEVRHGYASREGQAP